MKLKCYGCDAIVTPDMAIEFAGRDWCFPCHHDLGRDLDELERAAQRQRQQVLDEIQASQRKFTHQH